MSQPQESKVPKFGSFKPKAKTPTTQETQSHEKRAPRVSRSEAKDGPSERHRERRRDRESREIESGSAPRPDKGDRDVSSRSRSARVHNEQRNRHTGVGSIATELEESDAYIIDRRGDRKNVEYGSLHRYSIPTHYRTGYGRVIGATARVNRDESSENSVVLDYVEERRTRRPVRLLSSKSHAVLNERKLRLISSTTISSELDPQDDFVPLRHLKRKLGAESPKTTIEDLKEVDYRSINGKAKSDTHPKDADLQYATDSDEDFATDVFASEIGSRNAALSRKTKANPTDVGAWLDLIQHQAEVIKPGAELNTFSSTERRSLADVRLSIYEHALRHVKKRTSGHDRLVLGLVAEGALRWDNAKLSTKWHEVLADNPSSVGLWTGYLNFVQTNAIGFKYEQCRTAYFKCFEILHEAISKAPADAHDDIKHSQLYVLLRFTRLIRDAGYDELANAIWQATLEYHLTMPSKQAPAKECLEAFSDYWDSEYPRIGEDGAVGWSKANSQQKRASRTSSSSIARAGDTSEPFAKFANQEFDLLARLHLPAATEDESEEDPYSYVMFSDLQDVFASIQGELPRRSLINAFLVYMRMPAIPDGSNSVTHGWHTDEFLRADLLHRSSGREVLDRPVDNAWPTIYALFTTAFALCPSFSADSVNVEVAQFVDRVLEMLIHHGPEDDALAEYHVAFRLHHYPSAVGAYAKGLLKTRPTSIRLYNAYALIEAHKKRLDKARNAWLAAANLAHESGDGAIQDRILLWHSWMKTELAHGNDPVALQCLLAMCDDVPNVDFTKPDLITTPAQQLRFTNYIRNQLMIATNKHPGECAVMCADCHMYFAYLLNDSSLDSPLRVWATYLTNIHFGDAGLELLYQAKVELLRLHIDRRRSYKPAQIRAELLQGTKAFPNNSSSLDLLDYVDAKHPITNRIREAVSERGVITRDATIISWSHTIAREIRRVQKIEMSGSTQHSVRKLFVIALQDPDSRVKHSIILWKMWFDFERAHAKERDCHRVRQVFVDGLRSLPWCKAWLIHGLQYLAKDGHTAETELRQIYDVLVERELRIRIDIDEG